METREEFTRVKDQVKQFLKTEERCRNDDKYLTWRVMRLYTNFYIPFDDFVKIPAFETIRRTRAHIQNQEGLYPPTEETVIARRNREKATKDVLREWGAKR